jgi:isochorismate hydrolase
MWRLDPSTAGLLVIDMQARLMPAIREAERVLDRAVRMVRVAKLLDVPIWVTEQIPNKLGPTLPAMRAALADSYRPLPKASFTALPALPPAEERPRTLLVCGIETHVCVRQTIYDLRVEGTDNVHLLADAVGSRSHLDHQIALDELRLTGITIVSTESAAWEFLGTTDHPRFRDVLAILK